MIQGPVGLLIILKSFRINELVSLPGIILHIPNDSTHLLKDQPDLNTVYLSALILVTADPSPLLKRMLQISCLTNDGEEEPRVRRQRS